MKRALKIAVKSLIIGYFLISECQAFFPIPVPIIGTDMPNGAADLVENMNAIGDLAEETQLVVQKTREELKSGKFGFDAIKGFANTIKKIEVPRIIPAPKAPAGIAENINDTDKTKEAVTNLYANSLSQTGQMDQAKKNRQKRIELLQMNVSAMYAHALTTRININKERELPKTTLDSENTREILQANRAMSEKIAKRWNDILLMESQIAGYKATQILTSINKEEQEETKETDTSTSTSTSTSSATSTETPTNTNTQNSTSEETNRAQEDCKAKGGTWVDAECVIPEEETPDEAPLPGTGFENVYDVDGGELEGVVVTAKDYSKEKQACQLKGGTWNSSTLSCKEKAFDEGLSGITSASQQEAASEEERKQEYQEAIQKLLKEGIEEVQKCNTEKNTCEQKIRQEIRESGNWNALDTKLKECSKAKQECLDANIKNRDETIAKLKQQYGQ